MHATDQRAWPGMLPDQRACMAGTSMRKSKKLIRSIDINTIIYNLSESSSSWSSRNFGLEFFHKISNLIRSWITGEDPEDL